MYVLEASPDPQGRRVDESEANCQTRCAGLCAMTDAREGRILECPREHMVQPTRPYAHRAAEGTSES